MIVVNFATREYKVGQQRLMASLSGHQMLMFNKYEVIGSPTHADSPYEFKCHSIEKAGELDNIILWADASLWRVGNLSIIEDIIKRDGFFGEESGHYVRDWTNQFTKDYFKLTDQELQTMILYSAGLTGVDLSNPKGRQFLDEWKAAAKAGCFRGEYQNHRHDMSSASIIAQRLGFKFQRGGTYLSYIGPGYSAPADTSIMYLQGI